MNNTKAAEQKKLHVNELNDLIINSIQDIKGKNIIKIDMSNLDDSPADYFIICEGDSTTQVRAIANNVFKKIKEELGYVPHREGHDGSTWVLVDFFDTILHVFYPETRKLYDLEDLWSDAKFTEIANL